MAGVRTPTGAIHFYVLHDVQTCSSTMGTGGADSPGVKRQGLEADHSSPSSAEVNSGGAALPSPTRLHGAVLN
jgi:hypothetical protein